MTDQLPTAAELAAMKERCDKATAGPWFVNDPPWGDGTSVHNRTADPHGATEVICIGDDCGYETPPGGFRTLENMELISHSRTDLPRCLALIDAQAEELKELRRILCYVPGRIAIAAKEAAGFPDYIIPMGDKP